MAFYKTKSAKIEAVKFTSNNIKEVMQFVGMTRMRIYLVENKLSCIIIQNDELHVEENKYIVKGSDGDFYICSEDSFEEMYERINENV